MKKADRNQMQPPKAGLQGQLSPIKRRWLRRVCPCPLRVFTNEIKVFTSNGEYIFSVSSIVGKLLLNSSLSTLVSSYRAMPIGWDISSNAYSTTTSSLSLQIKKANPYKNNLWPSLVLLGCFPFIFHPQRRFDYSNAWEPPESSVF